MSSVERGKRNVSLINIHRLAIALELTVSELFDEIGGDCEWNPNCIRILQFAHL